MVATYIERMEEELAQLRDRIGKLDQFLAMSGHDTLRAQDRALLHIQRAAMDTYRIILDQRLVRAHQQGDE